MTVFISIDVLMNSRFSNFNTDILNIFLMFIFMITNMFFIMFFFAHVITIRHEVIKQEKTHILEN